MFFEPHTSTGCGVFAILGRVFDHFFPQIVSLREKTLKNTNLVPSRHFKRVKDSLSVDMHYSKTSLLKLPYNETRTKTRSRRGSRINVLTDFLNERRRRRKLLGGPGACPNGKFSSILTSQSPLSWVSESFRQDNLASSFSSDEALQLNVSIMKDLTDFRKTVETVVDPRLTRM